MLKVGGFWIPFLVHFFASGSIFLGGYLLGLKIGSIFNWCLFLVQQTMEKRPDNGPMETCFFD